MTQLSPAAQTILYAFLRSPCDNRLAVAATLRAAALEVVLPKYQYADWQMAHLIMQELQVIADELEGQ
jgi:hypothetical protein